MVFHITLSREKSINDKSPVVFVLATVYRPPGQHTDFIKEFGDFLSELRLAADKVLIVSDFNICVDNEKDALGSTFIDILNSIGVRQHVSGPTHCQNHTLDLIQSHGIDFHEFCSRAMISQIIIWDSAEKLDDVTEIMDSLFSSTLDTVAPLSLRKKEKSPTPWYNEHTRALKRAARKMECSWRKTKLEVFRMTWRESTLSYRKALKTARSDYFSSLLEENKHNPRYLFNTVAKLTKQ